MNYRQQITSLLEHDAGFARSAELIEKLVQRKELKVVNFSHHDLDGVACAYILQRLFRRFGFKVTTMLPEEFKLSRETLEATVGDDVDLLIISDKGTFASYDGFLEKAENILIVDHHTPDGNPEKAVIFNPSMERHVTTAASLLCHMLATQITSTDEYDDFVALVGCRGDFTFDPVEQKYADFVRPFIERLMKMYPRFFKTRLGRPTMYDIRDRRRTALINQIAEALHAGTLAHYYGDISAFGRSGQELVLGFLNNLAAASPLLFRNLEDFLEAAPAGRAILRALADFRHDWDLIELRVKSPIFLGEIQNVGVYLIFAREADRLQSAPFPAVLPYVASTQLEPLKRAFGHTETMIVVVCPKKNGVHISMRGGGGIIDCSRICYQLADRLRRLYPEIGGIEGGGHVDAAECFTSKSLPLYSAVRELILMMKEHFQETQTENIGALLKGDDNENASHNHLQI
ncbi:MAG: DHH family phosphoesterase [Hadesarchaea archaeon]|nr:DHH family phosphoesterase [Hadesarchaea archaeon]